MNESLVDDIRFHIREAKTLAEKMPKSEEAKLVLTRLKEAEIWLKRVPELEG